MINNRRTAQFQNEGKLVGRRIGVCLVADAKAIGFEVPPSLVLRADKVIEKAASAGQQRRARSIARRLDRDRSRSKRRPERCPYSRQARPDASLVGMLPLATDHMHSMVSQVVTCRSGSAPWLAARAANGHAAAPLSSDMRARRLIIRSPRRRSRAASEALRGRFPGPGL
jgi:hypothetical protein